MSKDRKPLSTAEAARLIGVSVKTLRKLIKEGEIAAFKPGKRSLKISPEVIEDYKARKARELRREIDNKKDETDDPDKAP